MTARPVLLDDPGASAAVRQTSGNAPLFYSEHDLHLTEFPSPTLRLPGVVVSLLAAETPGERQRLLRGMLHALGFEWLVYGRMQHHGDRLQPASFFVSHAPGDWVRRYCAQRYYEIDMRYQNVPGSGLPLVWDIASLEAACDPRAGARQRRFVDELQASGARSGVFFSLPSPTRAGERTMLSLLSATSGSAWVTDPVLGQALTLSLCVHEYLLHCAPLQASAAPARGERADISATQQDILHHLMQGQSDKEIAYRLQLSAHGVDYHMRQLRRRFSARNRVQLIQAAMSRLADCEADALAA